MKMKVEESEELNIMFSGKSIAKNTVYNIMGYGIPMVFAVVFIPFLIKGLGIERFGILNIVWIVIGYFSFFDFGIGKSLTKVIAEKIGVGKKEQIPGIFWNSLFLIMVISLIISGILFFLVPSLTSKYFNISKTLRPEAVYTFYALVVSIPILTTTAAVRGVLEAYQKFGVINILRVFLGTFTFLGPIIVLVITNSLFWIVVFLIFIRSIIWVLYLLNSFKINPAIKADFNLNFDFKVIKPVLMMSMWITVANIVGPLILYSDRFLIGILISMAAVTYYATPFEVVSKLLLLPSALVGVLYPVFSASFLSKPDISKRLFIRGAKFIFLIIYPIVFLIVVFAREGMTLWLGINFAQHSSFILQLIAIGILFSCISTIPNNYFQGIGKPKIPAILNSIELPFYLFSMWFMIEKWGINGAAIVWIFAAVIDTFINYLIAYKLFGIRFPSSFSAISFILMLGVLVIPFFLSSIYLKIIFSAILLFLFMIIAWKYFLSTEEKLFVASKYKLVYGLIITK